jgi:hypothetical protein
LRTAVALTAVLLVVAGCQQQSQPRDAGPGPAATSASTVEPPSGRCDGSTKPVFVPDNSDNAIVKGGSQGNVNPSQEELVKLVRGNGIQSGIFDSMMPKGGVQQAVLCPNGEIFTNGEKVANTSTNLFTRNPEGAIAGKTRNNPGVTLYAHPVRDVITAPCPALVSVIKSGTKIVIVLGVCLTGIYPVDWNGV